MKKKQHYGRVKTKQLIGVSKDTADRLSMGVTFKCKYVGSLDVPKPCSRQEIISDMRRIRREFRTRKIKKAKVTIMVSTAGIKVALRSRRYKSSYSWTWDIQGLVILDNPIQRVFYVAHDSQDLKIFSYISRDGGTNTFKCNVFKSYKRADSERIVRMIGQAFGTHRVMNMQDESAKPSADSPPEGTDRHLLATNDAATDEASSNCSTAPPKPPRQTPEATAPISVYHELQLLRQHLQLQEQHGQAALARAQLLKDQLRSETQARMEAQARVHQLLIHNRDLLDHINQLIQTLKELEGQLQNAASAGPGEHFMVSDDSSSPVYFQRSLAQTHSAGAAGRAAANAAGATSKAPGRSLTWDHLEQTSGGESLRQSAHSHKADRSGAGVAAAEQRGNSGATECMVNSAFQEDDVLSQTGSRRQSLVLPSHWGHAAPGSEPTNVLTSPMSDTQHGPDSKVLLTLLESKSSSMQNLDKRSGLNGGRMGSCSSLPAAAPANAQSGAPPAALAEQPLTPSTRMTAASAEPAAGAQAEWRGGATGHVAADRQSQSQSIEARDTWTAADARESRQGADAVDIDAARRSDSEATATAHLHQHSRTTPQVTAALATLTSSASSFFNPATGELKQESPGALLKHATVSPFAWSVMAAPDRLSRMRSPLSKKRNEWQSQLELIQECASVSSDGGSAPLIQQNGGDYSELSEIRSTRGSKPYGYVAASEADQMSAENFGLLPGSKAATIDALMAINFLRRNL